MARRPTAWNEVAFSLLDFRAASRNTTVSSKYLGSEKKYSEKQHEHVGFIELVKIVYVS